MLLSSRHPHPNPVVRAWRVFRRWRVSRPFWGGLFTLLAGLEVFGTTQMGGDGLRLQFGPTGFLSWLIPTILIACGLLMWFTPQQRLFYAIVAVVTAVFSLIAVNLGGFFLGLLLGVVGGALGFAWTPTAASTQPRATDPSDEPSPAAAPEDPSYDAPPAAGPHDRDPPAAGTFVVLLVLACLTATGIAAAAPVAPAHAASCPSAGVVRPAPAAPSPSGTSAPAGPARSVPVPSTSAPAAADGGGDGDNGTGGGNIVTDIVDGIRDLLGGGDGRPAADSAADPAGTPVATPDPVGTPEPDPGGAPTPDPTRPGACPTRSPSTGPAPGDESAVPKLAPEPGQPMVNREPSRLTGSKVTMYGLRLDGIVDLPTSDGPLRTLRFSMRRAVTDDFDLRIPGSAGPAMDIRSSALTVEGQVRFYATSFSGRFLGIPLTLTPESPLPPDGIPLTVPRIVLDDPQMRLAFIECDRLTAPSLDESFR